MPPSSTTPENLIENMPSSLSTSSPAVAISMFAPFPRLPAELRLCIWSLCRIPRIVCIRRDTDFDVNNNTTNPMHRCRARASLPAMLHACRESREFALQFYKTCFHLQLSHAIYFDPNMDSLFIADIATSNAFYRATLDSYRLLKASCIESLQTPEKAFRIAVQFERTSSPQSESHLMRGLMALSALFPSLTEILVVGYSTQSSSAWTEATFLASIPRIGSREPRCKGPYILGKYQLINGSLEEKESPRRLVPEIVFWSQEQWISWLSLTA